MTISRSRFGTWTIQKLVESLNTPPQVGSHPQSTSQLLLWTAAISGGDAESAR